MALFGCLFTGGTCHLGRAFKTRAHFLKWRDKLPWTLAEIDRRIEASRAFYAAWPVEKFLPRGVSVRGYRPDYRANVVEEAHNVYGCTPEGLLITRSGYRGTVWLVAEWYRSREAALTDLREHYEAHLEELNQYTRQYQERLGLLGIGVPGDMCYIPSRKPDA